MTRVALYARYSSDQQSSASIEDQASICRGLANSDPTPPSAASSRARHLLLNNELYIGKFVWIRLRYLEHPNTNTRVPARIRNPNGS